MKVTLCSTHLTELSPPSSPIRKSSHSNRNEVSRKRQKLESSETEAHVWIETPETDDTGRSHHSERGQNKQKVVITETEAHVRIETHKTDSARIFTSEAHGHTLSCDVRERKKQGKKHKKSHSERQWTYSSHAESSYNDKFVIVSYNILGVENAAKHPDLYRNVSPRYLDWDYRKKLICKEVKRYKPSILCFQEVDRFDDLNEMLARDGFTGLHKARSGDACDGCSIFWKSELFNLLHEHNIEFKSFGLRDNVAQLLVLEMNPEITNADSAPRIPYTTASRRLVVGNTHILFNPKRGDIKLGQMRIFLQKAHELSQEWGSIPVVLTGDLNSLPLSAMYQFLSSYELNILLHDRREISGQLCPFEYNESWSNHGRRKPFTHRWTDEEMMFATGSTTCHLKHQLKITSAYANIPGSSKVRDKVGEPQVTTYHCMFSGTVDYIWHTPELFPIRVLETLPVHSLTEIGGLPSKKWGSDHLALVCELAFVNAGD